MGPLVCAPFVSRHTAALPRPPDTVPPASDSEGDPPAPPGWEGAPGRRRPATADGNCARGVPSGALAAAAAAALASASPHAMLGLAAAISAARTVARWRERRARGAALKAVLVGRREREREGEEG